MYYQFMMLEKLMISSNGSIIFYSVSWSDVYQSNRLVQLLIILIPLYLSWRALFRISSVGSFFSFMSKRNLFNHSFICSMVVKSLKSSRILIPNFFNNSFSYCFDFIIQMIYNGILEIFISWILESKFVVFLYYIV